MTMTDSTCIECAPRGEIFDRPLALELAFTDTYRRHRNDPIALREAKCLRVQFPAILQPIEKRDLFAGRIRYPLVGFSPEPMGLGYYCCFKTVRETLEKLPFSTAERESVEDMLVFWEAECTHAKTRAAFPDSLRRALPSDEWMSTSGIAFPLYRMAGITLDYGKLLELGIPGLKRLAREQAASCDGERSLFDGMGAALDVLEDSCRRYAREAAELAAAGGERARELEQMSEILEALTSRAPETLREAIQLFWLYALLSGTWNYGRMDVYLGGFLADDLESGRITREEALGLLRSLWRLITAYDNQYNNRVFVGGRGRPDEKAADQFALLAIEATRTVITNQPQLSLRFYEGQNPELMRAALTCLGEGRTFPILYNDDVNIPAVERAFGAGPDEAAEYMPYGCGEYTINHASVGTPNGVINLLKCLEVALHGGIDPMTRQPCGIPTAAPDRFTGFEDLWQAYARQVEHHLEALALQEKLTYDVTGAAAPFLLVSLLTDDCVRRKKEVFSGGVRRLGGTIETYGNINVSDSLCAIRRLVYEDRVCTLSDIIRACDADFSGFEDLHRRLLGAPKFGNDLGEADDMARRTHDHVCLSAQAQAARAGLDTYLVVIINNSANVNFGAHTAASADGRRLGEPLANAVNPQAGRDRSGTTAFLNSLTKLDPGIHAGAVQNMKFSRGLFTRNRPKLEAMLGGYFRSGGTQAMITVVSRDDLEAAMREPEKWGHLMVRVGGFSARFIDLPRGTQLDVLARTLNE